MMLFKINSICFILLCISHVLLVYCMNYEEMKNDWFNTKKYQKYKFTKKQNAWWNSLSERPGKGKAHAHGRSKREAAHACDPPGSCDQVPCASIPLRKEYRNLNTLERTKFHDAVKALSNTVIDGLSMYQMFVLRHRNVEAPSAHFGSSFLGWHREFLLRFENALKNVDPDVSLPYYDSTLDSDVASSHCSPLWTSDYLGNKNGSVTTGPFVNFNSIAECESIGATIRRSDSNGFSVFTEQDINNAVNKNCFFDLTCTNVQCAFEGDHGKVHNFMGGHMVFISCSPTDPVFFMHHCFIDSVWEEFRQTQSPGTEEIEYPVDSATGSGHEWDSPLRPFDGLLNIHGLSNHYTELYYRYAKRPSLIICSSDADCQSEILWCNNSKCKSKICKGQPCGNNPDSACWCSGNLNAGCSGSICQCS